MHALRVRRPTPGDGPGIARVHVRAWRIAYAGLMPADYLASLSETERSMAWEHRLAREQAAGAGRTVRETLIAEIDSAPAAEIVGIATIGPDRDDPASGLGELWMINVLPAAWGTGVGPRLLASATRGLIDLGFRDAVLWVVEGNARARRFYEREGWRPDGGQKRQVFGGWLVSELRYTTSLATRVTGRRVAG